MNMQACLAVVTDGDVAKRAQHLALLVDLYPAIVFCSKVKPADGCSLERADRGQRGRSKLFGVGKPRQRRKGLLAGIEDDDMDIGRSISNSSAFHNPFLCRARRDSN